jgi:S-adenosylmethionine hydrolase
LEELGLGTDGHLEVRLEGHRLQIPIGTTFADVGPGEFIVIEDSYRHLSLAINKGDAAAYLRARAGSTAIVGPTSA